MSKQRFFIKTSGNDDNAYKEAIEYACALAENDPQIKKIVLLIATKENTGCFEGIFNKEEIKKLRNEAPLKLCRVNTILRTKQTYNCFADDIVITCGLDSDSVFEIDYHREDLCVKAIIAIPWLANGLDKWVKTWGPIELRTQQPAAVYSAPSNISKIALEKLTKSINMSTGIVHHADEHLAKEYMHTLYKNGQSLDANIIGAYLMRELGWEAYRAKDIENLINNLNS